MGTRKKATPLRASATQRVRGSRHAGGLRMCALVLLVAVAALSPAALADGLPGLLSPHARCEFLVLRVVNGPYVHEALDLLAEGHPCDHQVACTDDESCSKLTMAVAEAPARRPGGAGNFHVLDVRDVGLPANEPALYPSTRCKGWRVTQHARVYNAMVALASAEGGHKPAILLDFDRVIHAGGLAHIRMLFGQGYDVVSGRDWTGYLNIGAMAVRNASTAASAFARASQLTAVTWDQAAVNVALGDAQRRGEALRCTTGRFRSLFAVPNRAEHKYDRERQQKKYLQVEQAEVVPAVPEGKRCSMADAWQTLHANQTYGAKRSPTCDWYRVPKNERDLFSLADERRPVEW